MHIHAITTLTERRSAFEVLNMHARTRRDKNKREEDPSLRVLSELIAQQGGDANAVMQRVEQMKEAAQATAGISSDVKAARKQAVVQKIEHLGERAKQLKDVLQKGAPLTSRYLKDTARELKSIARELADAVKEYRDAKEGEGEGAGAGGGAIDVAAIAAAVANAANAQSSEAEGAERAEHAETAAADAEHAAKATETAAGEAERVAADAETAARQAEQQAECAATDAERADDDAPAAVQGSRGVASATGTDEEDKEVEKMVDAVKRTIRHAAGLLKARLKDQHGKEAKDCDDALRTLDRMDMEQAEQDAATSLYNRSGEAMDGSGVSASLGLSVRV